MNKNIILMLICSIFVLTFVIQCVGPQGSSSLVKISNFKVGSEKLSNVGSPMARNEVCTDSSSEAFGCKPASQGRKCWQSGELIYMGISKNTIKVAYREFLHDMARPALYQDLNYDLDKSDIIQFRGVTIKIIEANNTFIRFIALKQTEDILPMLMENISKEEYKM